MTPSWVDTWLYDANCLENFVDDIWFPGPAVRARERALELAREGFCDACPVAHFCARYALETASEGVWAGEILPGQDHKCTERDIIAVTRTEFLAAQAGWRGVPIRARIDPEGEADVDLDDAA